MATESFIQAINEMLQPFASNPYVRLEQGAFKYHEKTALPHGIKLSEVNAAFYRQVESFQFKWRVTEEGETQIGPMAEDIVVGGLANFLSLPRSGAGNQAFTAPLTEAISIVSNILHVDPSKDILPVDYLAGEKLVFFVSDGAGFCEQLSCFDIESGTNISPLCVNLTEYFETGLQSWFFYGWQDAWLLDNSRRKEQIGRCIELLKQHSR